KIGPTAIPAFWRENYAGLENFRWGELAEILRLEAGLFLRNRFNFRRTALAEAQKYFVPRMAALAGTLVDGLDMGSFRVVGKPGLRAQPVNLRERRLEMDFLYEGDERSFHLLNAVSPAFTCSLPFSEFLVTRVEGKVAGADPDPRTVPETA
ncbi:MAG TPA: L-2-hydroxyglutarate oxidase, partial [Gammaproteobacteria bacterium]|nr:L-2-hydroxyglutarate oxidase [Gammaproteobacteria bacterium]